MKRENGLKIVIVFLVLIIMLLSGYIVYDNYFKSDSEINNNEYQNNNQSDFVFVTDEKDEGKWMDYILSTDIKSIELFVYNPRLGSPGFDFQTAKEVYINLSKNDLKEIFDTMKDSNKVYAQCGGIGGPGEYTLTINYISNGEEYKFHIAYGFIVDSEFIEDPKLLSYLSEVNYNYLEKPLNREVRYHLVYRFNHDVLENIISKYS